MSEAVPTPSTRELPISDPRFTPVAKRSAIELAVLKIVNDERDLPFVWLSLQMTLVLIPFAIYLFLPGRFNWWLGAGYLATLMLGFFDRYILMLHNTSHRPLLKRKFKFAANYIPWVLGPLCGETPETYFVHHMTMHHAEGNLVNDLSSTMKYQRDSFFGFLAYFLDFFFLTMAKLVRYEAQKNRPRLVRLVLTGELGFFFVVAVGLHFAWQPTLVVLVIPFLLCRFLMMCGNWGQHAFVDVNDPGNSYRNSITCINVRYNRRCFNDGYHIGHHVLANRHWTDLPQDFEDNRAKYVAEDAVVFEGIDFFMVWFFLMLKRYDILADKFVELREVPRSRDEIIAFLKTRTKRIDVTAPAILAATVH